MTGCAQIDRCLPEPGKALRSREGGSVLAAIITLFLLPATLPAQTTNVFSPAVSYQYAEGTVASPFVSYEFGEGVSLSPLASYQYAEGVAASPVVSYEFAEGISVSPVVSYYYQLVLDSVGDGIPDLWRARYFGGLGTTTNAISCATCDPDGDGANNYQEYIADTNPTNALSYFHLQSITPLPNVVVAFQSSSNRSYTLYSDVDLSTGTWSSVSGQTNVPGTGGILTLTNAAPADLQMFFRVGVQLP
jgi:hypothetical protein